MKHIDAPIWIPIHYGILSSTHASPIIVSFVLATFLVGCVVLLSLLQKQREYIFPLAESAQEWIGMYVGIVRHPNNALQVERGFYSRC